MMTAQTLVTDYLSLTPGSGHLPAPCVEQVT